MEPEKEAIATRPDSVCTYSTGAASGISTTSGSPAATTGVWVSTTNVGSSPSCSSALAAFSSSSLAAASPSSPEPRSEEHTSELQSLMRISYAVFRLKKKTTVTHQFNMTQHCTRKDI